MTADDWQTWRHPDGWFSLELPPGLTPTTEHPGADLVAVAEAYDDHLPTSVVVNVEELTVDAAAWFDQATAAGDETIEPMLLLHREDGYLEHWRRVVRAFVGPDGRSAVSEQLLDTIDGHGVTVTLTGALLAYSVLEPDFAAVAARFETGGAS